MKIALLGAAGNIGTQIRKEALSRGHHVTAIVRSVSRLTEEPNQSIVVGDAYDQADLTRILSGHDAFISAFSPDRAEPPESKPHRLKEAHRISARRSIVAAG